MIITRIVDAVLKRAIPDTTEAQVRREFLEQRNSFGDATAARYSRGNTSIQRAAYMMDDELRVASENLRAKYGS